MYARWLLLFVPLVAGSTQGQVSITTGSYAQNFGTVDITTWTNNVTYPGWYQSHGALTAHLDITNAAPNNTGGFYTYECNGNNDQKIGSRASGSATNIRFGVVLRNQTGSPIQSLRVGYTGYQLSLAQNGGEINTLAFDYVTSATLPGITAASTASVPSLRFTQVESSPVAGANQINGYPCTRSAQLSACIALAVPLPVGAYILLRWTDVDNTNNDHHLAIDDVQVDFDLTGTLCSVLLPVELLSFDAVAQRNEVQLQWSTGSERNNDHFRVERSGDDVVFEPIGAVSGAGTTGWRTDYTFTDHTPLSGNNYYRLVQVDKDGTATPSHVVAVRMAAVLATVVPTITTDGRVTVRYNEGAQPFTLVDATGRPLHYHAPVGDSEPLDLSMYGPGIYWIQWSGATQARAERIMYAP